MDFAGMQWVFEPAVLLFLVLTLISIIGRFFKIWLLSCLISILTCALIVIVIVTVGQLAGKEDAIRFYITSHYRIWLIELTLRDILLYLILLVSFHMAVAGHILDVEKMLKNRISWIPRKKSLQYEMEHTLETYAREHRQKCDHK